MGLPTTMENRVTPNDQISAAWKHISCPVLDAIFFISAPKRQNPLPLLLVRPRNRALKFFGSFQLGLPSKVPQTPRKVVANGAGDLGVYFPSFRHAFEAIKELFSANFVTKRIFQTPHFQYFLNLRNVKTPFRCKTVATSTGRSFDISYLNR